MKLAKLFFSLFVVFTFFNAMSLNIYAQEKKISKEEVPSVIMKTFHNMYPKAEIKGTSVETENGKKYYELETVEGKKHRDLLFTKDGTVQENEETIEDSELPVEVMKTLNNKYKGFEIKKAEKVTSHNKVSYELHMKNEEKAYELVFNSKGKLLTSEKKQNEKGESEENDEDNDGD